MNLTFLNSFVRNPRNVGSLMPSSRYLGSCMKTMVDEFSAGPMSIAVLGVGTAAVARGFTGHDVYGYDMDHDLLAIAAQNMPSANLRYADVSAPQFSLQHIAKDLPIAIVSCIPVANLSQDQKSAFENKVMQLLDDRRVVCFIQYSYIPRLPLDLPGLDCSQRWVFRNVPPAGIFLWQKPEVQSAALTA